MKQFRLIYRPKPCVVGLMTWVFRSSIPAKKLLISERNWKKRLSFYYAYKSFSNSDWKLVTWSDESRSNLFHSDGKMKVWRQSNVRFNKDCILKKLQGSGGPILIWPFFYLFILWPLLYTRQIH